MILYSSSNQTKTYKGYIYFDIIDFSIKAEVN